MLEIETLTLCHRKLAVNSRAEMEIGRYHWMYPGSKNHQYRPVPTLGDRANPLSSPGKYSLGVHSHVHRGWGGSGPLNIVFIIFLFLSSSPFHPIFPLFLLPPPYFLPLTSSSQREQGAMRCALELSTKCLIFEPPVGWGSHMCPSRDQELNWDI